MSPFFTKKTLSAYLEKIFPETRGKIEVLGLTTDCATTWLIVDNSNLRPGGTISGPSMFLLADLTFYILVLSSYGKTPLAVTSNCTINFFRKPKPYNLIGKARMLKKGKSLAMGDVFIESENDKTLVAQASFTYSVPRNE